MQESSSSIGALAAALAKAQIELVNPEKSMTATIPADDEGGAEQVFRYAPLSSGLEILRKTLGQHEIAILQATAIDHAAGVVKLTTTLCHSSGEWVGSTWPVCSVDEMASLEDQTTGRTKDHGVYAALEISGMLIDASYFLLSRTSSRFSIAESRSPICLTPCLMAII